MMPADVVTAQAEYSVCPTKYRLSKTFTGSACHVDRSGGPAGRGAAGWAAAGARLGTTALHTRVNTPAKSSPAAPFAAATCAAAAPLCDWATVVTAPIPTASDKAATDPARSIVIIVSSARILPQSSFHGLFANTASSGHSTRPGMLSAAKIVPAMSSAYSLLGLLRPVRPPHPVWTSDGQTQTTRIPCGRNSVCQHWLIPRTAHLLPAYAVPPSPPFMPDVEAIFTMSPWPCAFNSGTARLVTSTIPKTLVANNRRIASTSSAPISAM